jgi:GNAT superfamily N-acetyltransferase
VEIRPWRAGDDLLAGAAGEHLSTRSLSRRFLAGTGGTLPPWYRRHLAAGPRPEWDAQIAVADGCAIGWAEYGRAPGVTVAADLAVIVVDAWHRRGVATGLIRALLPRAFAAGVRDLGADLLPDNTAAQALLRSLFGADLRGRFADGTLRFEVSLSLAVVRPDAHRAGPKSTSFVATVPAVRPGAVWSAQ